MIHVSSTGEFAAGKDAGDAYLSGKENMSIVLHGVDLTSNNGYSDAAIINKLLGDGKLHID
ncbi:hypothetical protein D3C78_1768350 [compost metagenome]